MSVVLALFIVLLLANLNDWYGFKEDMQMEADEYRARWEAWWERRRSRKEDDGRPVAGPDLTLPPPPRG